MTRIDFSNVNLQYLLRVRDIAREDSAVAAALLGISPELAGLLAEAPSEYLTHVTQVRIPLLVVRGDEVWWNRFLKALIEENLEEVNTILQAAGFTVLS